MYLISLMYSRYITERTAWMSFETRLGHTEYLLNKSWTRSPHEKPLSPKHTQTAAGCNPHFVFRTERNIRSTPLLLLIRFISSLRRIITSLTLVIIFGTKQRQNKFGEVLLGTSQPLHTNSSCCFFALIYISHGYELLTSSENSHIKFE